mgnify:CR=1 FL=1
MSESTSLSLSKKISILTTTGVLASLFTIGSFAAGIPNHPHEGQIFNTQEKIGFASYAVGLGARAAASHYRAEQNNQGGPSDDLTNG